MLCPRMVHRYIYIMLIVSFPGPDAIACSAKTKGGWGLGMRRIISMNLSVSLKKSNYYKIQGTITFKSNHS